MAEQNILVKVGADIAGLTSGLNRATNDLRSFGERMSTVGSGIQSAGIAIGATFGAMSAGIITGIVATTSAASSYESAFAGVRKTVDTTEVGYAKLSKGIRDMSKELPASANEIAKVAEAAGQLGIKEGAILGFTRTMVDLGESTNMSADDAATALARLANITQMPQDKFDRLGSTVVALGNNLATTESEIVEMGLRIAGAGNQVGLTEDQILSFAGALSSVGINAEAGGTAFSRVFLTMNSAVMEGGKALDDFAATAGVSSADFKKAFQDDAANAAIMFIKGLDNITKSGGDVTTVLEDLELNEIRVRDSLMRASGAGDLFTESLKIGSDAWKENTALTKEATERYKTFASRLSMFKNRITGLFITLGGPFIEVFGRILTAIEPVIRMLENLAEKFANSNKTTKNLVVGLTLALAAFTAIVAFVGLAVAAIGGFIAVLGGLSAAAGAIGISLGALALIVVKVIAVVSAIGLAIVATIAIFVAFYKRVDWFRKGVDYAFGKIKQAFIEFARIAMQIFKAVGRALKGFTDAFFQLMNGDFSGAWSTLKSTATTLFKDLVDIAKNYAAAFGRLWGTELTAIKDRIKSAFEMNGLSRTWDQLVAAFDVGVDLLKKSIDVLKTYFTGLVKFWSQIFDGDLTGAAITWYETMSDVLGGLSEIGRVAFEALKEVAKAALADAAVIIKTKLGEWSDAISDWASDLKSTLSSVPSLISEAVGSWFTSAKETITEKLIEWGVAITSWATSQAESFRTQLAEWGDVIAEWFANMPETITTLLGAWRDAMVNWTQEQNEENKRQFAEWAAAIGVWFNSIPEQISEWLVGWLTTITTWFSETKTKIVEKLAEWMAAITTWFQAAPSKIGEFLDGWWTKISTWFSEIPAKITKALEAWWAAIKAWFTSVPDKPEVKNSGKKMIDKVSEGNEEKRQEFIDKLGALIVDVIGAALALAVVAAVAAGRELIKRMIDGIGQMRTNLKSKMDEAGKVVVATAKAIIPAMIRAGADAIGGFISGMASKVTGVVAQGKAIATSTLTAIKNRLEIRSPSRALAELGAFAGQGLAKGMAGTISLVTNVARMMSEAAKPDLDFAMNYRTPTGAMTKSLSKAVNGTVDVSNNSALNKPVYIENVVEMDNREVARAQAPVLNAMQRDKFRITQKLRRGKS